MQKVSTSPNLGREFSVETDITQPYRTASAQIRRGLKSSGEGMSLLSGSRLGGCQASNVERCRVVTVAWFESV